MPDLILREYNYINGPETPTLPTPGTATSPADIITKNYADKNFWRSVATLADIKAIAVTDRSQYQIFWVNSLANFFKYDSSSSATGNDITVITPTDTVGRYLVIDVASFLLATNNVWTGSNKFSNTFSGDIEADSTTTGSDQTLTTPTKFIRSCSNASLASIAGITAPSTAQFFVWTNATGSIVAVKDSASSATAGNRILTGVSADLSIPSGASLWFFYDFGISRWKVIGGSGGGGSPKIFGSTGSPRSIAAAAGFTAAAGHMSTTEVDQTIFAQGPNANSVNTISATPQMQAHTVIGAKQRFVGTSDTQPVQIVNGNGFVLKGPWTGYNNCCLNTFWNGSAYVEEGRNDI